jgi:hypothetical protein
MAWPSSPIPGLASLGCRGGSWGGLNLVLRNFLKPFDVACAVAFAAAEHLAAERVIGQWLRLFIRTLATALGAEYPRAMILAG